MNHNYKVGRPFGGQAWFINSSFEIFDFKFINKHLSFVHIRKDDVNCVLIGTYMPFDDNSALSRSEYELNISLISSILYNFDIIGVSVFIVGNFNANVYRQKTFDKMFSNFVSDVIKGMTHVKSSIPHLKKKLKMRLITHVNRLIDTRQNLILILS